MEEGRKRERKVWEREKSKTSKTLEEEAGGFPRRAQAGPDAENNGPLGWEAGREVGRRLHGQARETFVLQEPRPRALSWVPVGRDCPGACARARVSHRWEELFGS